MDKAKSILGSDRTKSTAVSGYVQTPIEKKCSTCEYFKKPNFCSNKVVRRDPKVKTDPKTGRKVVDGETGCCNEWTP